MIITVYAHDSAKKHNVRLRESYGRGKWISGNMFQFLMLKLYGKKYAKAQRDGDDYATECEEHVPFHTHDRDLGGDYYYGR